MRLVRSRVGGGMLAAITTWVVIACAKGTDSGLSDDGGAGGEDASRDVFVIPDDSATPDKDTGTKTDAAVDAPVDADPGGTHVVINEVQTAGATADAEIVELYNPTSSSVSLANWEIRYASSGGGAGSAGHKFNGSATIGAKGYVVLKTSDATWTSGMSATDGQIGLFDGAGAGAKRIDGVAWGSVSGGLSYGEGQEAPSPPSGGSIGRSPNGVDTDKNSADFKTFATTSAGAANN